MNVSRAFLLCTLTAFGLSLTPADADAQVSRVGATFSTMTNPVRGNDVAFDSKNQVYLVVAGTGPIRGRFVSATGVPIGSEFNINSSGTYQHFPRVAYSPDAADGAGAFLVTWHQTTYVGGTDVYTRIVRYSAGSPVLGTESVLVVADSWYEAGAAVAYATTSKRFMVVWQRTNRDIGAAFVRNDGTVAWTQPITTTADGERDPTVAYNAATDEFLVLYSGYNNSYAFVKTQLVSASTGNFVGAPALVAAAGGTYITDVAYDAAKNQYLATWWAIGGMYGRLISAAGTPLGAGPSVVSARYQSYDALGLAYNKISGTYFAISHDLYTYENGGVEIDPDGSPLTSGVQITNIGGPKGNFYPRLGASTASADWVSSTAHNFVDGTYAQLFTTATRLGGPPPPPPPPPCSYALSSTSARYPKAGGSLSGLSVTTNTGCAWSASSSQSWVTITSPTTAAGTGSGSVSYIVAENLTTSTRSATLTIAGKTHTITQAGISLVATTGKPVLFWQNKDTGEIQAWLMNGGTLVDVVALPRLNDLNWNLAGQADFNLDGHPDLLFQNLVTGELFIMSMFGGEMLDSPSLPRMADPIWQVAAIGDMNRDGYPDLIWQHQALGGLYVWYLNGTTVIGSRWLDPEQFNDTGWKIVGATDFNNDGQMDLLVQHIGQGWLLGMTMENGNGWRMQSSDFLNPDRISDVSWRIVAVADLDGDGKADDFVWYHQTTGRLAAWPMEGRNLSGEPFTLSPDARSTAWRAAGPRLLPRPTYSDVDDDNQPDLLAYNPSTGGLQAWLMNGKDLRERRTMNPDRVRDLNWRPITQADFNGDGRPDMLWQHTDGYLEVFLMNGTELLTSTPLTPSLPDNSNWMIGAVYDVNGDGRVDILWQNRVSGDLRVWYMNNLRRMGVADLAWPANRTNDPNWRMVGTGDVNGDGHTDILWWHSTDAVLQFWYMNGTTLIEKVDATPHMMSLDLRWRPIGLADLNGDGFPDIVWQHSSYDSYWLEVWYFVGGSRIGLARVTPINRPEGWTIVSVK